jgi:hypothetical protein
VSIDSGKTRWGKQRGKQSMAVTPLSAAHSLGWRWENTQ